MAPKHNGGQFWPFWDILVDGFWVQSKKHGQNWSQFLTIESVDIKMSFEEIRKCSKDSFKGTV